MRRTARLPLWWAALIAALLLVAGCGNDVVGKKAAQIDAEIEVLNADLHGGELLYATLLEGYANWVIRHRPEHADFARGALARTRAGNAFIRQLKQRLRQIPDRYRSTNGQMDALYAVEADVRNYEAELRDNANTLAAFSDGELPEVPPLERLTAEELRGNPAFGEYREDASGNSFWAWYGQYALFSALIDGLDDLVDAKHKYKGHYARIPGAYRKAYRRVSDQRYVRDDPSRFKSVYSNDGGSGGGMFASSYSRADTRYSNARSSSRFTSRSFGGFSGK
ncbi:hypothetical protein [Arhodomonas sp. AD133]|uniref:hypothetical protein n=1 Tax=Arhodomonas sp. AD133 TaxID=3415009 RepID=UPI003EBD1F37